MRVPTSADVVVRHGSRSSRKGDACPTHRICRVCCARVSPTIRCVVRGFMCASALASNIFPLCARAVTRRRHKRPLHNQRKLGHIADLSTRRALASDALQMSAARLPRTSTTPAHGAIGRQSEPEPRVRRAIALDGSPNTCHDACSHIRGAKGEAVGSVWGQKSRQKGGQKGWSTLTPCKSGFVFATLSHLPLDTSLLLCGWGWPSLLDHPSGPTPSTTHLAAICGALSQMQRRHTFDSRIHTQTRACIARKQHRTGGKRCNTAHETCTADEDRHSPRGPTVGCAPAPGIRGPSAQALAAQYAAAPPSRWKRNSPLGRPPKSDACRSNERFSLLCMPNAVNTTSPIQS